LTHPFPLEPSRRYVLLVLDDRVRSISGLVSRAVAERGLVAEIVVCEGTDEAVARLRAGRRYSAVVAGGPDARIDDVRPAARRAATPVIVVGPSAPAAAWLDFAIRTETIAVRRADELAALCLEPSGSGRATAPSGGRLVAVCGAGGTGTSVIAAAVAAGLADQATGRRVLLADFALRSDQALLHRLPGTPTGLLDLIALFRYRRPAPRQVRSVAVDVGNYRLLPGLGRPTRWTAVPPGAFDAALPGLRAAFEIVVADVTGEFEGEHEVGSIDAEERNHMARRTVLAADVVVVVGGSGTAATRRLGLLIANVSDLGVDPSRIQPVVNRITDPGRPQWSPPPGPSDLATAIGLPELSGVDTVPLPMDLAGTMGPAVAARLRRKPAPSWPPVLIPMLTPVLPGSIGCWPGSRPA
jgi:Flp pilus assembly CpaE family ATPase